LHFGRVFKGPYQRGKNSVKFLRNLMESLLGRLKVIKDGKKNHTKYPPEELYTQRALFRDEI
jgi:hypothetical protein